MTKIVVIEDDPAIREGILDTLRFHGYEGCGASDGVAGLEALRHGRPDLLILDLMLPGIDGFDILRLARMEQPRLPVILLTARGMESDKLLGFELGADDYITKPFSIREVMARVKALLKRSETGGTDVPGIVRFASWQVDFSRYIIRKNDREYELTPKECGILRLLLAHTGEVIGRERIIEEVWGDDYEPTTRTIDNFILKLRAKIEDRPDHPQHILTVHGAGYKFIE